MCRKGSTLSTRKVAVDEGSVDIPKCWEMNLNMTSLAALSGNTEEEGGNHTRGNV
jgi:hypothetical protein